MDHANDNTIDGLLPFVEAMAKHAGTSRRTAYEILNAGKISAVKVGARTMVRKSEMVRFLDALPSYSDPAPLA